MDNFHQFVGPPGHQIDHRIVDFLRANIAQRKEEILHLLIEKMPAVSRIHFEQIVYSLDRSGPFLSRYERLLHHAPRSYTLDMIAHSPRPSRTSSRSAVWDPFERT